MMKTMIRGTMKLLFFVVFLGFMMIWIMMPTKLHRTKWLPAIRAKSSPIYFGRQGPVILEFTFPALFMAIVGCIYLHLRKKSNDKQSQSTDQKNVLSPWKRPALVKGPLGVVSWIELSFFTMFIALLSWTLVNFVQVDFAQITPAASAKHGEQVWETKLHFLALRLGFIGNLCLAFLFFPVTRGSSILPLFGLTSESSIKYHIWLGHITMTFLTAHGLCYIIYWAATNHLSQMVMWAHAEVANIAGELALLAGLAMWVTSFPQIRRKFFELFLYTHYLYIVFAIFFIFHVGIEFAWIAIPNMYLFVIDRYLRFLQSRQNVRLLSSRLLPCETVELNFSKSPALQYNTTSIIFINVPSISKLQWHPFTITSNSNLEPEMLSIVIKKEGSWSQKLYQILSVPSTVDRLNVAVEGPYGPSSSTQFLRHDTLVMVSGGSGITPFFSIIREIIFLSTSMNRKTPKIILVSAFKNSADLTMLDLLLPITGSPSEISRVQLQIEAYVTREKQQNMDNKNLIRTIWFKPNASDQSISAILGPNYWLWLGAIISCSFIIYLILMGIITRYYIYPIEHETHEIFASGSRTAICILIICVSIGITGSAVVFKNKNRNAMEAKQIQNMDAPSPRTSPGSWFQNGDRELESLPQQSLVQATNVHYGSRPDLKKILFECEGSSVGALVSGPKQMRHDVATICSSGLADNLHFESISFSW